MKENKHTPGPWIVDDRHVHTAKGLTYPRGVEPETDVVVLVDTDCHQSGLLNDTDRANLQLIASAPELLGALESIVRDYGLDGTVMDGNWEQARQAIAKAKGQI